MWLPLSGQPATLLDIFVQGDRFSLAAAITTEGYIATHVVPGSLDSFEFYNFIAEDVVSFIYLSVGCQYPTLSAICHLILPSVMSFHHPSPSL